MYGIEWLKIATNKSEDKINCLIIIKGRLIACFEELIKYKVNPNLIL